jgi:tetratricopeptide (TPR) repeat protein
VKYVLGKAYYLKGKYYLDLAIRYLSESLEEDFEGKDTFEYLGLCYYELNDFENSILFFKKALKKRTSDILLYKLSDVYYKMEQYKDSEENLIRTLNKTKNPVLEKKSRYLLGNIFIKEKEYLKAENQFNKIVEKNPNEDNAYYLIGNIYEAMGLNVKARSKWRKAIRLNPYHSGARHKLYD